MITVIGTDDQGATGTASIDITVETPSNPVPIANITLPTTDVVQSIQGYDSTVGMWYIDLTLQGTGFDEGVQLTGSSLVWRTSRTELQDAVLGTGDRLTVRLYTDSTFGLTHQITLTVTDDTGQPSAAALLQVRITGLA